MKKNSPALFDSLQASLHGPLLDGDGSRTLDRRRERVANIAVLFLVFVCVAVLAMNAWMIVRARATEIDQTFSANTNLARAVSHQIEGSIALADHIILGIAFELERSELTAQSLLRLQPVLVKHVSEIQGLKGLFVYDKEGRWLVHSEPLEDKAWNNSDRDYFVFHRDNQSASTRISGPIVSRSSGEWVIPVSRRINDSDGNFAGVVLATLRVRHLRVLLDRFQIGNAGAIGLFQTNQLLMRRPFKEADMGRRSPESQLQKMFQSQRSGITEGRSGLDGVTRFISFEHLMDYPLFVTVAVGKDESLQDWRIASIYQTVWVALLCIFIGASGSYLVRSMRRRLSAERRLRKTRDALTEVNERLAHLAQYDGLTGLANRRYFETRLARNFEQAQEQHSPVAVVMVDVDEFKKYNDLYGHLDGDECLRRVAQALRTALRRSEDFIARYGGEEMVFLLPDTDLENAAALAEQARLAVLALQIPHAMTSLGLVSVSLGVAAQTPQPGSNAMALMREADERLYRAKHDGRNRVAAHS